jgi:hypothetical protein
MSTEPKRTCPSCGNEFSGAMEFCPICMLRKCLAEGAESGASSFERDTRFLRESSRRAHLTAIKQLVCG